MAVFDDGKDQGALRTIGEVGRATGIKPHVLRYWEAQFPQLQPVKRSGGRRYYRPADVALVETIDRLVNREGYTLKGALLAVKGAAVKNAGEPASPPPVAAAPAAPDADFLPRLKAIRDTLKRALAA